MKNNGIVGEKAETIINYIASFSLYGFPESHSASFALITYASAYLKSHFPAAFYASLLNNQPMGFYHPATLVKDAQKYASLNNELQLRLDSANDYKNELISKLRKHDLARLSLQKPGLVEEKINNGTKRLFEKFERITSADTDNTTDN